MKGKRFEGKRFDLAIFLLAVTLVAVHGRSLGDGLADDICHVAWIAILAEMMWRLARKEPSR